MDAEDTELTIRIKNKFDVWFEETITRVRHETDEQFLDRAKVMLVQLRREH